MMWPVDVHAIARIYRLIAIIELQSPHISLYLNHFVAFYDIKNQNKAQRWCWRKSYRW
jgi:hypothetical protein